MGFAKLADEFVSAEGLKLVENSELKTFADRHIGPSSVQINEMLEVVGCDSLDELVKNTVPENILLDGLLDLDRADSESDVISRLRTLASLNSPGKSYIGMGYYPAITPGVVQRNILEDPGWYTQYTPYQAEIAQGRLEALLNYQTVVCDLTGMELANSSLLDEATAAAEAMVLCFRVSKDKLNTCLVSDKLHPQTLEVLKTRAKPLGIDLKEVNLQTLDKKLLPEAFSLILQYPDTDGEVLDWSKLSADCQKAETKLVVASDLLALTLLKPPGEWGADVVVGSAQRFGVGLGFGGPHAGFFATKTEYKRFIPGRIVGVSKDRNGKRALRLALQVREQHIKRDRATSNICTAQVLLAIIASMYAVYHGPKGLRGIASLIHAKTCLLKQVLEKSGLNVLSGNFFDTLKIEFEEASLVDLRKRAEASGVHFRYFPSGKHIGISLSEVSTLEDLDEIVSILVPGSESTFDLASFDSRTSLGGLDRQSEFLESRVFSKFQTETELLRYINQLRSKDLSLAVSMIPLGSCTMKLNATTEMLAVTWPEFSQVHPFIPSQFSGGYQKLIEELENDLAEITGFAAVSLQPNAGSQGEYAGLLAIQAWHQSRGDNHRNVCLIPESAHGTNPASAIMAGMKVKAVRCDEQGNIDVEHLKSQIAEVAEDLAALMVTYPSTHGVFEESIREVCSLVHEAGGQVYMDGANLNAQVGLCQPGEMGADVCHLNLHKTFCIPHGGGGPGVGPIGVAKHLADFLPGHPLEMGESRVGPVSAAPWGSAGVLAISWAYIKLMGTKGLKKATQVAILNANYLAKKLEPHFPVLYKGSKGFVAHECILDLRGFKKNCGVSVEDVAKRLMDYGFHAPTVSWPVIETLMVEPTESESLEELDRFVEAMKSIREEIAEVEVGEVSKEDNLLKNAPHTALELAKDEWPHPYSRHEACWPVERLKNYKFWPAVARIDSAYGDRNLICSCVSLEDVAE